MYCITFLADTRMDIAFIVSNCGHNPGDNFLQQLDLARNTFHSLPVDPQNVRTAIISVSDGAKIIQDLEIPQSNPSAVSSAFPPPGGLCTFGQGLETTSALLKAKGIRGVPQVLVVLLAGKSDDDISKPANDLRKAGVLVYSVGLKETVNESTVSDMASDPISEYFISSPGFPDVDSTKKALLDKLERGLLKIISLNRRVRFNFSYI